MYHHAPENYICPICIGIRGIDSDDTLLKPADLVFKDEVLSLFINSFWIDTAEGHVIVVPNSHYENIYDLPESVSNHIFGFARKVALAMKKSYHCDGITLRQNNEPASSQHALHFHLHIFPRYEGDSFDVNLTRPKKLSDPALRQAYVDKLKKALAEID